LKGYFVTEADIEGLPTTAPLYVLIYGVASLFLGLLFSVSKDEIGRRLAVIQQHQQAGIGTVIRPFCRILETIAMLILNDPTGVKSVESTCEWLDAFPQSR
jgi:hypothetical protein